MLHKPFYKMRIPLNYIYSHLQEWNNKRNPFIESEHEVI